MGVAGVPGVVGEEAAEERIVVAGMEYCRPSRSRVLPGGMRASRPLKPVDRTFCPIEPAPDAARNNTLKE